MFGARSFTMALVASLVITVSGNTTRPPAPPHRPSPDILSGEVAIVASPERNEIAVTVDEDPADGTVDHAFRVQLRNGYVASFLGQADVLTNEGALVVSATNGQQWTFALTRSDAEAVVGPAVAVFGIARIDTSKWRMCHAMVAARLLSPACAVRPAADGSPGPECNNCDAGGGSDEGCQITCGDFSCSAQCSVDTYACCSCATGCRCCRRGVEGER